MTPQNTLELEGSFHAFPLAELLVEIGSAGLSGSLRFSQDNRKVIVYFQNGKIVYAVSNARSSRLFDILLRENKIDKITLTKIPNFTSDLELGKALVESAKFSKSEIDSFFSHQIELILGDALSWNSGEWVFNPLAQIRSGINFEINLPKLLTNYSRKLNDETVINRFTSMQETFLVNPQFNSTINLQPHEAFVLSRFDGDKLTIEDVKILSGLPDSTTLQTLYTLWLGGFLTRKSWNSAFNERQIAQIKSANLVLKQKASVFAEPQNESKSVTPKPSNGETSEPKTEAITEITAAETEITLENYLAQVQNSSTFYDILGVSLKASTAEIKQIYFKYARQFHPDLFHNIENSKLQHQIQNAFTKLAGAYETLRDKDLRQIYDFKLRKELAKIESTQVNAVGDEKFATNEKELTAAEQFDQGYGLLMDEYHSEAVPFLARAVYLVQNNARYHAFYGKALSYDKNQRHKAENEIQTAIRLEPENELYRLISAEFFISHGLVKRAEGELKRLLTIAPNNREAQVLLDRLQNS